MQLHSNAITAYLKCRQKLRVLRMRQDFERYFGAPQVFASECIVWKPGEGLTAYQGEALQELEEARRYSIVGPHGLGKTALLAIVVLWFAITSEVARIPWKLITTAGSWGQLRDYLWPEVHIWAARLDWSRIPLPQFTAEQLLTVDLRLKYGFAVAKASKNYAYIEGAHAPRIMIMIDEGKTVPIETFNACEGALSSGDSYEIVTSTPELSVGTFYDIHSGRNSSNSGELNPAYNRFRARHVTKEEVIAAGRMDKEEWADIMRAAWGPDSALYLNRVEGKFAEAGANQLFPAARVRRAIDLHRAWKESGGRLERIVAIGSDLAGGGSDQTINAIRQGRTVIDELPAWFTERWGESGSIVVDLTAEFVVESSDLMEATGAIAGRLEANPAACAVVDAVQLGTGVVSRLQELLLNVIPVRGGTPTEMRDATGILQFKDLRSAWIWRLADLLKSDQVNIAFPEFTEEGRPSLSAQMSAISYRQESNGRIKIISKPEIRKLLRGFSTDALDTLYYAYAPEAGGVFKRHWWRFWRPAELELPPVMMPGMNGKDQAIEAVPLPALFDGMVQAWHTAYKDDDTMQGPAYAVGQVQAYLGEACYVIDQVRARMDLPSCCAAMLEMGEKWPGAAALKVVDRAQNGKAVVASMRRQVPGIQAVDPVGLLTSRANAVGISVYGGGVYLPHPEIAPWIRPFIQECCEFPNGANSEQVSALVLGFRAVRGATANPTTEFGI